MPNKVKVTKEDIINSSLEIVKKDGLDAVNARKIAKDLNCSIQPVYYYFSTMDTLRSEIKNAIKQVYNTFMESTKADGIDNHFKAVGEAYIRFASLEPNYFKVLFMDNDNFKFGLSESLDDNYEYIVSSIVIKYGISREQALAMYENVWVTTHGLAVMIATGFMRPSEEKISSILTNAAKGQLMLVKGGSLDDKSK